MQTNYLVISSKKHLDQALALRIYLILSALFITSLVASNLIFKKFFHWDFFGLYTFKISVGILPYPITFLITDCISEIYGKKRANQVVTTGIFASIFSLSIVLLADAVPAIENSPIGNELFHKVFGSTGIAVGASMTAYLLAQYVDINIYHFWKKLTKGKYLWLRNNFSTFLSQFIDTFSVIFLLSIFGELAWRSFFDLLISGFLFKVLIAGIDTPFLYLIVYWMRRKFRLAPNEELKLAHAKE